jgi:hypothetical protein
VLDKVVFTDLTLHSVITSTAVCETASEKVAARPRSCAVLCETTKQAVNLCMHQDGGRHRTSIPEILESGAIIAEISMP